MGQSGMLLNGFSHGVLLDRSPIRKKQGSRQAGRNWDFCMPASRLSDLVANAISTIRARRRGRSTY
jgi:hypothetical protein